jgi:cyclopropane fatty-acyl-phospholipid synthase-like methyltransferase
MGFTEHLYSFAYRHVQVPWDSGPRQHLVELVESGRIPPGRAIDLGSGTASNAIFLAQHGFDVTGVDFAAGAVELGRQRAAEAGVPVDFVQDDLTDLRHVRGPFDFVVDYGTLDDLSPPDRDLYLENVLPLTDRDTRFLLYCFEWEPRWWERPFFFRMACEPGEIERRFGPYFDVERYAAGTTGQWLMPGWAVYLMRRKQNGHA